MPETEEKMGGEGPRRLAWWFSGGEAQVSGDEEVLSFSGTGGARTEGGGARGKSSGTSAPRALLRLHGEKKKKQTFFFFLTMTSGSHTSRQCPKLSPLHATC